MRSQGGAEAVANLQAALALVGLILPSLGSDGPAGDRAFVRLGGCGTAVANQLADVIAAGAHALQAHHP
ncbi:hypothetical protein ACFXA3_09255 [Streptomyces sp. NPDC059456]|uniref:hypothetical protein n=1 Tax=Streptomyces sp. NPDC059456 TaxID=3346838 RepID=UPI00369279E3